MEIDHNSLQEICHIYDVVWVDDEKKPRKLPEPKSWVSFLNLYWDVHIALNIVRSWDLEIIAIAELFPFMIIQFYTAIFLYWENSSPQLRRRLNLILVLSKVKESWDLTLTFECKLLTGTNELSSIFPEP